MESEHYNKDELIEEHKNHIILLENKLEEQLKIIKDKEEKIVNLYHTI